MPDDLIRDAEQTQRDVHRLALQARERFRRQIWRAAGKWAMAKLVVEQSFAHLGLLLYAVLAVVGMVYAWAFYSRFDIAILDFYETPDFLLSVASDFVVLLTGFGAVIVTLLFLLATYAAYTTRSVYGEFHSLYKEVKDAQRSRRFLVLTFVGGIVALPMPFVVASVTGAELAEARAEEPQPVLITLRSGSAADAAALPEAGRTILVGTTNRYHFFYQCNAAVGDPPLNCEGGEPFIVGTDNVAAISYGQGTEVEPPTSEIAAAIGELAEAVSGIDVGGTITIDTVDATLDTEELAAAIGRLAEAAAPLKVEARLDPSEVTLRPVVDPPELRLRAVVDPSELTVKAQLEAPDSPITAKLEAPELPIKAELDASDLTVEAQLEPPVLPIRAQLEPSDLTVKAELPDGTIPAPLPRSKPSLRHRCRRWGRHTGVRGPIWPAEPTHNSGPGHLYTAPYTRVAR